MTEKSELSLALLERTMSEALHAFRISSRYLTPIERLKLSSLEQNLSAVRKSINISLSDAHPKSDSISLASGATEQLRNSLRH
jgi:hypothetical protein